MSDIEGKVARVATREAWVATEFHIRVITPSLPDSVAAHPRGFAVHLALPKRSIPRLLHSITTQ
jgi:hypothetical protein